MNVPFFLARRYFFSRKKYNAVNIISGIAVCGIMLATAAMICTLSVFNGFQDLVATLFTNFDPELKVVATQGKVFNPKESRISRIHDMDEIEVWCETLEEQAMLKYKDRQTMCILKGVESNFKQLAQIDSILLGQGNFKLTDETARISYGVLGVDLTSKLNCGLYFTGPMEVYAPKRNAHINLTNPSLAFNRNYFYSPGSVFMVNQEKYDSNYTLVPLSFARKLFNYTNEVSAIEIKLKPGSNVRSVQKTIQETLGNHFLVLNRYEQQADAFKIMKIEKLMSYIFLTFILTIASFNIIGSLSMLIVDKKHDMNTLKSLGADHQTITNVFLYEGRLITLIGATLGILLGLSLCLAQQCFGIIKLGTNGHFIIDSYPVNVESVDVLLVLITVILIGFLSSWYPVKFLTSKMISVS